MLSPFLIVTPAHRLDARLAIAGARAGETGILDLGYGADQQACGAALRFLVGHLEADSRWGLRWDTLGDAGRELSCLQELLTGEKCPVLLLAGVGAKEQVESPFDPAERRQWGQLDGSETVCVGEEGLQFRFFSRSGSKAVHELHQDLASGMTWSAWLRQRLVDGDRLGADLCIAVGQEIAFARHLADKHSNVAGILEAFRRQIRANLETARQAQALAPDAPLAQMHGTRYPILQGPMMRVSDTAAFARAVADNGGLPFLALALMSGSEVNQLLSETRRQLGERPWGVGVLGFVPAELRKAQLAQVLPVSAKPRHHRRRPTAPGSPARRTWHLDLPARPLAGLA